MKSFKFTNKNGRQIYLTTKTLEDFFEKVKDDNTGVAYMKTIKGWSEILLPVKKK